MNLNRDGETRKQRLVACCEDISSTSFAEELKHPERSEKLTAAFAHVEEAIVACKGLSLDGVPALQSTLQSLEALMAVILQSAE